MEMVGDWSMEGTLCFYLYCFPLESIIKNRMYLLKVLFKDKKNDIRLYVEALIGMELHQSQSSFYVVAR